MSNLVVWFDMPVRELDRAIRFYSAVLGTAVEKKSFPGMTIGLLPTGGDDAAGCLHELGADQPNAPSATGTLIYLNCAGRLDAAIAAVESNGGKVLVPKHQIGPWGYRAIVLDCEGNRVALHST